MNELSIIAKSWADAYEAHHKHFTPTSRRLDQPMANVVVRDLVNGTIIITDKPRITRQPFSVWRCQNDRAIGLGYTPFSAWQCWYRNRITAAREADNAQA